MNYTVYVIYFSENTTCKIIDCILSSEFLNCLAQWWYSTAGGHRMDHCDDKIKSPKHGKPEKKKSSCKEQCFSGAFSVSVSCSLSLPSYSL